MKTISELDNINIETHGFSRDGIPEAGDTIRMDVVGGFVLQRISKTRSFFRAVANMDIKLDFVPPSLINFISRQLIGSGHKLYQKAVSTVATYDDDYKQALKAPLYVRIREYQDCADKAKVPPIEDSATEVLPENSTVQNPLAVTNLTPSCEIVEDKNEHNAFFKVDHLATGSSNKPAEQEQIENKLFISPEVEEALGILDTAISVLRGNKTGNISAVQKFLGYNSTSEGSAIGSRNSHTNILDENNLPNEHPVTPPPQDSREIWQAHSLSNEKAHDREEDDFNSSTHKNMTASTITKTKSVTSRSATRVHEEESLNTNGFHQNAVRGDKESKRARKVNRWLCGFTTSTIG